MAEGRHYSHAPARAKVAEVSQREGGAPTSRRPSINHCQIVEGTGDAGSVERSAEAERGGDLVEGDAMILEPDLVTRFYLDALREGVRTTAPADIPVPTVVAAAPDALAADEVGFHLYALHEDRAAAQAAAATERSLGSMRAPGQRSRREAWNLDYVMGAVSGRGRGEAPLAELAMLAAAMRALEYAQRVDRPRQKPVAGAIALDPDSSVTLELTRGDLNEPIAGWLRASRYGLRPAIAYRVRATVTWIEKI